MQIPSTVKLPRPPGTFVLSSFKLSRLWKTGLVGCAFLAPLNAEELSPIPSEAALGIWDFNDPTNPAEASDSIYRTPMTLQGGAVFSADGAGRSGQAGDFAINFGLGGGHARMADPALMTLLNQSNLLNDELSIVFWQRWLTSPNNSSTVWINSTSAIGERGLQSHLPWGDGTVFFDTSGCCTIPSQRLSSGLGSAFPSFDWQHWHHIALIKNRTGKQIWIDGKLLVSQSSGVAPLLSDWTELLLGQQPGAALNSLKGLVDDFALFGMALEPAHIAALAAGSAPAALVLPPESRPPRIENLVPAEGTLSHPPAAGISFTISTLEPNEIDPETIRIVLNDIDSTEFFVIGGSPQNRTVTYAESLEFDRLYSIRVEASDQAGRVTTRSWTFDTADPATTPAHPLLDLAALGSAVQAGDDASRPASDALDGNPTTYSESADVPGAFWELELSRQVRMSRVSIVAPTGGATIGMLSGTVLRIYNLRDQLLFEAPISNVGPGATWSTFVPPGIDGRIVRVELPPGQTNGAGNYRIAIAEIRISGDPSPTMGPIHLRSVGTATQPTTSGAFGAALAIDGNPATFSETTNILNSYWLLTLDRPRTVHRIELLNRNDSNSARMGGLAVTFLDAQSEVVATAVTTNPGPGGSWTHVLPADIPEIRFVRIGLEGTATNSQGNRIVSLAEVSLFTGIDHALDKDSYMVRLTDNLPPAGYANDGDVSTFTETTTQTVDGYWETDLGESKTLHSVRVIAFDSGDHQRRLAKATLRLFDAHHESVYSQLLGGDSAIFDITLPGPIDARYVRVGYENKQRSSPSGGIEWWLRLREVQAFGDPDGSPVRLDGFSSTLSNISSGESSTLRWQAGDLQQLTLFPGIGSVGIFTALDGSGSIDVNPTRSTEYILVGTHFNRSEIRYATILVDEQPLPPQISEFVASNRLSMRDGYRDAPDWVEIRNPNATPLDLGGYGLSDNAAAPFKWVFPPGTMIAPHGCLIVFASGQDTPIDPMGYLHANFSLSAGGESVVLTDGDGAVVDAILNYPPQGEDLAYGRGLDGTITYLVPTPEELNLSDSFSGWLEPPAFSHSRGFYENSFSLAITNPNPDSQLFISLDGSEPTIPYTAPIAVNGSLTVRAAVRRDGYRSPGVTTHTYLFCSSVMNSPLMNTTYTRGPLAERLRASLLQLPTVCLSVPQLPDDYNEREASVEIILPDGSPPVQLNAGINRVGGSWTDFPKRSYRLSFRPRYGARRLEVPLFRGFERGIPTADRIDTLDLKAGNHDMEQRGFYMSNRFVEDAMIEMGNLNPHGRFVHVYINGVYHGQYNAHERLDDAFLADYLGGQTEDYVVVRGNDNVGDTFVVGTPDPEHREPWEFVRANRHSYHTIKDQLDVQSLIDFMLVWFYGDSESEFRCAGPIAPGSGFKFWMADADGFLRTSALSLDRTSNPGPGGLFGALVSERDPDFMALLADRIHKHFFNHGALTPNRNLARLDARMEEVRDSLIAECARWGFRTPANWESAAQAIRTGLFPQRTANLLGRLRNRGFYPQLDAPILGQYGGSVSEGFSLQLSGSGTIYYTLDGSDPRRPGGAVSPTAQALTGGQVNLIAMGSTWRYRDLGMLPATNWMSPAYNDNAWSAGPAPLGYGSSDEATVVSYGPSSSNKYRTTYFRKTFAIQNPAEIAGLSLSLIRDDGAAVYLNGTEIARSNLPSGAIGNGTFASATVSGNSKYVPVQFVVPASLLVAGTNVIAAEVHQVNASSNDLRFDLALSGSRTTTLALDRSTTVKARVLSGGNWSALTEASFQVAHPLIAAGPYVFSEWSADQPAGSFPPAFRFYQSEIADPGLGAPMDLAWTLPYHLESRSRINGLGTEGVAFINTGNPQPETGAGFVGAAVLALDTTGAHDIRVRWTGGTILPNERDYGIRLQFRIGDSGEFLDVTDGAGKPVEYLRAAQAGHSAVIGPVTLPAAAEDQPLVELRWQYYFRGGDSGPRAQLRIDDIQVTAGPVIAESLAVVEVPAITQAGTMAGPVTVQAFGRNGAVADSFSGLVHLLADGSAPVGPTGTLSRIAVDGQAVFDDLVFPEIGMVRLVASADGMELAQASQPTRVVGMTELVTPGFIQGSQGENHERVPFASLVRIDGLQPNARYRFANQMGLKDEPPTQQGAGNMVFTRTGDLPYIRSTSSPDFAEHALHVGHGEFTTDADGSYLGWFITEPTGNYRFAPGNSLRAKLLLNDGDGGEVMHIALISNVPVQTIGFGVGASEGSAVFGEAAATARNLMVLYENADGSGRPLAAVPIENTGALAAADYAEFYRSAVAGHDGRWGAIVPNSLAHGVRRFEERDLETGEIVAVFRVDGVHFLTRELSAGGVSTGIRIPAAGASAFDQWVSGVLALPVLDHPDLGGAAGDADGDGISNWLEFAFGLNPLGSDRTGLPVLERDPANPERLLFRYRRRIEPHDLAYIPELSLDAEAWELAEPWFVGPATIVPHRDGLTETVTWPLAISPEDPIRLVRVKVRPE